MLLFSGIGSKWEWWRESPARQLGVKDPKSKNINQPIMDIFKKGPIDGGTRSNLFKRGEILTISMSNFQWKKHY